MPHTLCFYSTCVVSCTLSPVVIFIVKIEHHGQLVLARLRNNPAVSSVVRGRHGEGRHRQTHIVLFLMNSQSEKHIEKLLQERGGGENSGLVYVNLNKLKSLWQTRFVEKAPRHCVRARRF